MTEPHYSLATIRAAFWEVWRDGCLRYFGQAHLWTAEEVTASYWEEFQETLGAARQARLAPAIAAIEALEEIAGHLHIVLDDENYEDADLDFCRKLAEWNDLEMGPARVALELRCIEALGRLTEDERADANEQAEAAALERWYRRYPEKRPEPA